MAQVPVNPSGLLSSIVASSDDAIVSKDLNGVITSWNRAAERMFGYPAEEAIGKHITMIIPADRLDEEDFVLSRIRKNLSVDHFETIRRRKNGQLIQVSLTVSPIHGPDGGVVGASKIARDITQQRELAAQLEEANRLKDEFLATLSHELRTPLHSILGYTQMLRHGGLDRERQEGALQIIERNAKVLAQLVSDVLDISRIISGKIRLELQRCDLGPIVTAALDSVQPTFAAKGVRLERLIEPRPIVVLGDPARLQQIIWNLLTNAVKFTPTGGRVQLVLSHSRREAEIVVTDSGIGIAPEFLPHLFERFRQADSRPTRQFGGLGLGLALVRHFTELHGGAVQASSEGPAHGSTFRVQLPMVDLDEKESDPGYLDGARTHALGSRLRGVTVLAVDDDQDSLQLLEEILSAAGATVLCASSANGALRILDIHKPDVIVSDLGMPGRDGFEFIAAVRQRGVDRGGLVPAAALTAYARAEDRRRALAAGFQMHLSKPIDPNELIESVAGLASAQAAR
jgi:PAS domain S-box-containing protein